MTPSEPDARLEIGFKPGFFWLRLLWVAPLALGLIGGGAYALWRRSLAAPGDAVEVGAVWLAAGAIMLVVALDAGRLLFWRGCVVAIDAEGVFDRRWMRRKLLWREISRAEIRTQDGRPIMIGFWAPGWPGRNRIRLPLYDYGGMVHVMALLARPFRFPPNPIDLQPLDAPPERVLDMARRHWGEPLSRPVVEERPKRA